MNFSTPFIARPVATILLAIGLLLSGVVAYQFLPVAALPSVDIPTIVVMASRPGADPETMASTIAAPLERRLGQIPGVSEITSTSSIGNSSIIVQFDIDRDINGAAHDVQAAINAAMTDLPADLPSRPYYRKFNPADAPIMTIALSSDMLSTAQVYDAADTVLMQRLSQVEGVGNVTENGAEKPAVRVQLDPVRLAAAGLSAQSVYTAIRAANVLQPTGSFEGPRHAETIGVNGQMSQARQYAGLVLKAGKGTVLTLSDVATVINGTANTRARRLGRQAAGHPADHHQGSRRQRHRHGGPHPRLAAAAEVLDARRHQADRGAGSHRHHPRQRGGRAVHHAADHRPGADGGGDVHAPPGAHRRRRRHRAAVDLRHAGRDVVPAASPSTTSR